MQDSQLKLFINVADLGSFSATEKTSYLSKQAIMKQIENLEEELGVPLFYRDKKGVRLTKEGQIFYTGARHLLDEQMKLTLSLLQSSSKDYLRIGSVQHQVLLDPVTELFMKTYPDIRIERIIHPNHSGEWRVQEGIQDIAESFISDIPNDDTSYKFHKLKSFPYYIVMDESHPLGDRDSLSLKDIQDYHLHYYPQMILESYKSSIRDTFIGSKGKLIEENNVDMQIEMIFSIIGSCDLVLEANPFIHSVSGLKLVPLELDWERVYGLIYKEPMNPLIRMYIEIADRYFGN